MKTICFKESKISAYLFDDVEVQVNQENIIVGDPVIFIVGDMNITNAILWENIQAPNDWYGGKYLFDGTNWTNNPDFKQPIFEINQV
jgi:hypothetical protein